MTLVCSGDRRWLVLWDIDHTLLSVGTVSRELYAAAFETVTGQPVGQVADMVGRTERAIIGDTLRLNGVPDDEPTVDAFYRALGQAACALSGRMRQVGRALPGAREALAGLVSDQVVQSVVTGNIRPIAVAKLAAFDLSDHLDLEVGGYGDDGPDRSLLVQAAIKRAQDRYQQTFPPEAVVVLGDTPHDIRGAHDAGVRAVGVALGTSSPAELAALGADAVLATLESPDAVREAVFGVPVARAGTLGTTGTDVCR